MLYYTFRRFFYQKTFCFLLIGNKETDQKRVFLEILNIHVSSKLVYENFLSGALQTYQLTTVRFAFHWIPNTCSLWSTICLFASIFATWSVTLFYNFLSTFTCCNVKETLVLISNTISTAYRFF